MTKERNSKMNQETGKDTKNGIRGERHIFFSPLKLIHGDQIATIKYCSPGYADRYQAMVW